MTEINNTPSPLVPQGSLQEQSKRKSQVRIIVFSILAIHVVLLGALLIQGCRPEAPSAKPDLPPPPTNITDNLPLPPPTNVPPPPPLTNALPPTAPPTVVENPPANPTEHIIQKGDTFAILAKKYGVSVKAIQQANPGVDPTRLKIGQKIAIPQKPPGGSSPTVSASLSGEAATAAAESAYTVKKGDTLTKIATDHGVTIKALRAANNLKTDQIKPGQQLKMPAKAGVAAAPPAPAAPAPLTPPPPVMTATSAPALPAAPASP